MIDSESNWLSISITVAEFERYDLSVRMADDAFDENVGKWQKDFIKGKGFHPVLDSVVRSLSWPTKVSSSAN